MSQWIPWNPSDKSAKQRRLPRSCDICREKKVRCDSAKVLPGQPCSNCRSFGSECTHFYSSSKKNGYTFGSMGNVVPASVLKGTKWPQAKELMNPLLTDVLSSSFQPPTNLALLRETLGSLAQYARVLEKAITDLQGEMVSSRPRSHEASPEGDAAESTMALRTSDARDPSQSAGEPQQQGGQTSLAFDDLNSLSDSLKRSLLLEAETPRFFGPSNHLMVVKDALDFTDLGAENATERSVARHRRHEYWRVNPWEAIPEPTYPPYEFPEPDLLEDLVEAYFKNAHHFHPFLHKPTIKRGLATGLHLVDDGFGGLILAVCAVAGQHSSDPRVLLNGPSGPLQSGGFKWFRQLRLSDDVLFTAGKAPLYPLQTHTLALIFMQGTSKPDKTWYLIGTCIRAAEDFGFNRGRGGKPTVESEQRKRLFHTLVLADGIVSAVLGRTRSLSPSDYDLDPPIECDDEYWENEDPALCFQQPPGKPSTVALFTHLLKLWNILGEAQIAFYSVRMPTPPDNMTVEEWSEERLATFDSKLNQWADAIPEHLRWDPSRLEGLWLDQSALLYCMFYWIQIFVHRPFIGFRAKGTLAYMSLAICTNAARACSKVMDRQRRMGTRWIPQAHIGVFMSGVVLLLNVWRARQVGIVMNEEKELQNAFNCIKVLKAYEKGWQTAGRYCDVLYALLETCGQIPLPELDPGRGTPQIPYVENPDQGGRMLSQFQPHAMVPEPHSTTSFSGSNSNGPYGLADGMQQDRPTPTNSQSSSTPEVPVYIEELSIPLFQGVSEEQQQQFTEGFGTNGINLGIGSGGMFTSDTLSQGIQSFSPDAQVYGGLHDISGDAGPASLPAFGSANFDMNDWLTRPVNFDWTEWGMYIATTLETMNTTFSNPGA